MTNPMKLPKITTRIKFPKLAYLKKYGEFFAYGAVLVLLGYWQWRMYGPAVKVYQDLILVCWGLEIINVVLGIIILPKARLLAQFFMLSAVLMASIVVYYLIIIVKNVV